MARKRDISPQLWENEQLGSVPREVRLLFIGCISAADDEGRLKGSARYLKGQVFRYDDDLDRDMVGQWRDMLQAAGVLCLYTVDGAEYLHFPTWHKWQSVNKSYPSTLPACPQHEQYVNGPALHTDHSVTGHGMVSDQSRDAGAEAGTGTGTDAGPGTEAEARTRAQTTAAAASEPVQRALRIYGRFAEFEADPELVGLMERLAEQGLDVVSEALKASSWLREPKQVKAKRRCSVKFVVNWLAKAKAAHDEARGPSPPEDPDIAAFARYERRSHG